MVDQPLGAITLEHPPVLLAQRERHNPAPLGPKKVRSVRVEQIAALIDEGAPSITLLNRTRKRAERLAEELGGPVRVVDWDARNAAIKDAALLTNTTTLGMTGKAALDISLDALPIEALVNDVVYVPLETPLLVAARARGNATVDGLGMLLHQGRPGFAAWFGVDPQVTDDLRRHVLSGTGG